MSDNTLNDFAVVLVLLPVLYIALVTRPKPDRTSPRQGLVVAALYLPSTIAFGLAHRYLLGGLFLFLGLTIAAIAAGVHSSPRTPQPGEPGETPEPTTNAPSDPFTK
ncbi:hypothetical protein [Streptomyces sp. NPDC002215]|uniref:hypothetical protein n=1 Tax=Streptomyces sp. NPDC002215 TaxID=3154412 RepID=UPI00331EBAA7